MLAKYQKTLIFERQNKLIKGSNKQNPFFLSSSDEKKKRNGYVVMLCNLMCQSTRLWARVVQSAPVRQHDQVKVRLKAIHSSSK